MSSVPLLAPNSGDATVQINLLTHSSSSSSITQYVFSAAISNLTISNHNIFRVLFDKIDSVFYLINIFFILALEMASPGNQLCAHCIGTLSFPITIYKCKKT